jgi:hypothetical protein
MRIISNARRVTVMAACAAAVAAGTLAATASMATASTAASVRPLAAGSVCGTAGSGTTSWSASVGTANWSPLRSTWVKQPPGCHDYNIVRVGATGNYAGYLEHSDGTWHECSAGYILIPGGQNGDWVECSSVATGTRMTTDTTQFPGGESYQVNY